MTYETEIQFINHSVFYFLKLNLLSPHKTTKLIQLSEIWATMKSYFGRHETQHINSWSKGGQPYVSPSVRFPASANLVWVFNNRCGSEDVMMHETNLTNLKLKIQPKQLLRLLPFYNIFPSDFQPSNLGSKKCGFSAPGGVFTHVIFFETY